MDDKLTTFQMFYEAGDIRNLTEALKHCLANNIEIPEWVKLGILAREKPIPRRQSKLPPQKEVIRFKVWNRVGVLRSEGIPMEEAVFERVGEEFNISSATARRYYYWGQKWAEDCFLTILDWEARNGNKQANYLLDNWGIITPYHKKQKK